MSHGQEPLVHLLLFFPFFFLPFSRSKFAGACAFSILSQSPFFLRPLPPHSPTSSSRPRRRASSCRRCRRAAHPQHDSACWPPRPTAGSSFSLNRRPPSTTPPSAGTRARGPLPHSTAFRRLVRPPSPPPAAKVRAASASSLRCSGSAGAPGRPHRHPSGICCSKGSALHAAVLQR